MPKKPKKKWFKGPLTGQGHGAYMTANGRTNGNVPKKKIVSPAEKRRYRQTLKKSKTKKERARAKRKKKVHNDKRNIRFRGQPGFVERPRKGDSKYKSQVGKKAKRGEPGFVDYYAAAKRKAAKRKFKDGR